MRRSGSGSMFSFGSSKAKKYEPTTERVTFADVAGIDEAKEELAEVVDFLRDPDKYRKLGARIPRGVLLTGNPGTGKTLLAKAVAGEAGVPFFSMSASEFVEMIVGVGASRVRDLFKQAEEAAPSIIFIDEIDAIGRSRSSSAYSGANDEREQTLNQILTEMDGFDASTGVIVLAATNRPDVLDSALLRPGTLRPPRAGSGAGQAGPRADPARPHARPPARAGRRPGRARRDDGGHGRRRPRQPRERGSASGRAPQARAGDDGATSATRSRRSSSARPASWCSHRPTSGAPPTTRPGTRSSGCSPRAQTRCGRSRSSRAR